MSSGFTLKQLVVTGPDKEPALLEFSPTMTIVTGASNTGKTYAFATIYYLLNGDNPPKSIEPADGYQFAHLEICDSEMKTYTIRRHLKGGAAEIFECPFSGLQSTDPAPRIEEGLNEFLLRLSKLEGKRVKKNEYFETGNLTFR